MFFIASKEYLEFLEFMGDHRLNSPGKFDLIQIYSEFPGKDLIDFDLLKKNIKKHIPGDSYSIMNGSRVRNFKFYGGK